MSILPQPSALRRLAARCLDSLLPGSCLLCAEDSTGSPLCTGCQTDLPWLHGPHCPRCALPTTHGEQCGACLVRPPAFTATHALFHYEFPVDRLIQAFKYGHRLSLAPWLARQLAERIDPAGYDCIMPLPLHPTRLTERGFNQSAEISRRLARYWHMAHDPDSLVRERPTLPQAGLAREARQDNVRRAFACQRGRHGLRILLIDDVMTSGATLDAAARALLQGGAARVEIAVAARAFKD